MSDSSVIDQLIHWLSSSENPPVNYLTTRDFAGTPPSKESLYALRTEILAWKPLTSFLSSQQSDGGFPNKTKTKSAEPTLAGLALMTRCGLSYDDDCVRRAVEYIAGNYAYNDIFTFRAKGSGVLPCYVGMYARIIATVAGTDHPHFNKAIEWILEYQRFDHKEVRAGGRGQWPFRSVESYGGCWRSVSCYHGVVATLRALSSIPERKRSVAVNTQLEAALNYLRIHRVYKKSSEDKPLFRHFSRYFLYGKYRLNLIDVLEGISEADPGAGAEDWVRDVIETVDRSTVGGKVISAASYPTDIIDPLPFEKAGKPSRFLTYQWLITKRKFAAGASSAPVRKIAIEG